MKKKTKHLFTLLELNGSSFEQIWSPFTQGWFASNLVEIGPAVMKKNIFNNVVNVFLLFGIYLPFEMGGPLYLNKHESTTPNDALCQVWLKLDQWFWSRIFIFIWSMYFCYSVFIFPLKRAEPLFEQTWVLLTEEFSMQCLVEIGPVVQYKIFKIVSMHFLYLVIISPWKRMGHFVWRKKKP